MVTFLPGGQGVFQLGGSGRFAGSSLARSCVFIVVTRSPHLLQHYFVACLEIIGTRFLMVSFAASSVSWQRSQVGHSIYDRMASSTRVRRSFGFMASNSQALVP